MVFGVPMRAALASSFVIPAKAGIQFLSFHSGESLPFRHPSESWDPFAFSFDVRR
jgi:hypothetical protein